MMRMTSRPATRPATFVAARCSSLKLAGTVMTARSTTSPSAFSAICLARRRTNALISGSVYSCPRAITSGPCPGPSFSSNAKRWRARRSSSESHARPMRRLTLAIVFLASTTRRSLAPWPTRTSPLGWKETTLGSSLRPCSSGNTLTRPLRTQATTVLVVPRSIPTTAIGKGLPQASPSRCPDQVSPRRSPCPSASRSATTSSNHRWTVRGKGHIQP